MKLAGCFTAQVTPFSNGRVDYDCLEKLVERQMDNGVSGIVPVGTSGESPTLSVDEHQQVIETTIKTVAGRGPVIAGTGANSTAEAVELSKHAAKAGADATLQVTPYYNKPTQEGLYRHFSTIADESGLPIVLYQVPGRSGTDIAVETIERLAKNERVIAVKEACSDIDRTSEILSRCDITVLSGDDSMTLPRMIIGGQGVISVASNALPHEVAAMVSAALAGNWQKAQGMHAKLYPLFRDMFIETNPIPVKAAMAMLDLLNEEYRLPLCKLAAGHREQLAATLESVRQTVG
ncbi:MAG: 4-hydroxy-tetrahydrodipicolinate synthase [Lentisphaeria bacterium]